MSRLSVINLAELPAMQVLETIDTETILAARMADLKARWLANDPPAGAAYDVDQLEFDPIKINQEVSTYFELLLRDRVNQAARSVTLAFAAGSDLDAIASRYPGGIPRLPIVPDPRPYSEFPTDWESDDRYRRRIWLSPNLLGPHGVAEQYEFWALTADPLLRDAVATSEEGTGKVYLTIMAEGADPRPTVAQISAVRAYIYERARRGITDVVNVLAPTITPTRYRARVWLYPNVDETLTMTAVRNAVAKLVEKQRWIGYDHSRMAFDAALAQSGVHHAIIDEPAVDLNVGYRGLVQVQSQTVTMAGRAE